MRRLPTGTVMKIDMETDPSWQTLTSRFLQPAAPEERGANPRGAVAAVPATVGTWDLAHELIGHVHLIR